MEKEPTSPDPRGRPEFLAVARARPCVSGAEIIHRGDGASVLRLRATHRPIEGLLWRTSLVRCGVVCLAPPRFEKAISRLAVYLALEGTETLLLRPDSDGGAGVSALDLRSGATYLRSRGARKFCLAGADRWATAAVVVSSADASISACALFSPASAELPLEGLSDRMLLIACGEDDHIGRQIVGRRPLNSRLLSFPLAPEELSEVAADLAANWVPAVLTSLR
jgi:hypothetical protein